MKGDLNLYFLSDTKCFGDWAPVKFLVVIQSAPTLRKRRAGIRQTFMKLADEYPEVIFMEADATINSKAMEELNIVDLPSYVAFKNHLEIGRYQGLNMEMVLQLIVQINEHILDVV